MAGSSQALADDASNTVQSGIFENCTSANCEDGPKLQSLDSCKPPRAKEAKEAKEACIVMHVFNACFFLPRHVDAEAKAGAEL